MVYQKTTKKDNGAKQVQLYKDNKRYFCKKPGHKSQDCRKKKPESANAAHKNALMATTAMTVSETTWIANLGVTCHITNDLTGLYNINPWLLLV